MSCSFQNCQDVFGQRFPDLSVARYEGHVWADLNAGVVAAFFVDGWHPAVFGDLADLGFQFLALHKRKSTPIDLSSQPQ